MAKKEKKTRKMSAVEAGQKGGNAPHDTRGLRSEDTSDKQDTQIS